MRLPYKCIMKCDNTRLHLPPLLSPSTLHLNLKRKPLREIKINSSTVCFVLCSVLGWLTRFFKKEKKYFGGFERVSILNGIFQPTVMLYVIRSCYKYLQHCTQMAWWKAKFLFCDWVMSAEHLSRLLTYNWRCNDTIEAPKRRWDRCRSIMRKSRRCRLSQMDSSRTD